MVWLAIGSAMLITAGVRRNHHLALASAAPLCLSAGCWLGRPRHFRATLTDDGIEIESPPDTLPYDDMEMIKVESSGLWSSRDRIVVYHRGGVLEMPANLNVLPDALHDFLVSRIDINSEPSLSDALEAFLAEQKTTFGPDRVWVFGARAVLRPRPSRRLIRFVLFAMVMAGVIWLIAGIVLNEPGWVSVGVIDCIFSGLILLATWAEPTAAVGIKNWRQAALVISPLAMALSQGDVQGQLRWNELRDVRIKRGSGGLRISTGIASSHIRLKIDGAEVVIADIYNASLTTIREQIYRYWRGPA